MDQIRFGEPAGRRDLSGGTPALQAIRFDPPRLATLGGGRISRSTAEVGALAEAREEGRQQALAQLAAEIDGHRRARHDLELAARALVDALDQIEHADLGLLHDFEQQVLALGVALAEELVGRELRAFDDVAVSGVTRALSMAPDRGAVVLRVHPGDLAAVVESAAVMGHRAGDVQVVADATIERGGCIAVAGSLQIDAQLGTALQRIREALSA